jgi:hypothetical protein
MRDDVFRCPARHGDDTVNTILSYDGVGCHEDEEIACVKVTDCSHARDGANVDVISGNIGQPYIRLNITSHPGKGYNLCVEMRGVNPLRPNCR